MSVHILGATDTESLVGSRQCVTSLATCHLHREDASKNKCMPHSLDKVGRETISSLPF